jgi:hypothetical protein
LSAVDGLLLVLGEGVEVIRLHAGDQPVGRVGADVSNHVRHRGAAVDAPAVQRPTGETHGAGFHPRHRMARGDVVEYLRGHARRDVEDEFGRNETSLADRRQVAAGAQRLNLGPDDALASTSTATATATAAASSSSSCTTATATATGSGPSSKVTTTSWSSSGRLSRYCMTPSRGCSTVLAARHQRKKEERRHPFLEETAPLGLVPYVQAQLLARHLRGDLDAYPPWFWK